MEAVLVVITPPTLSEYVFSNTGGCTFYVPSESVKEYKAASGWSDYEDYIGSIL